jgi:Uma2 family endonuclease
MSTTILTEANLELFADLYRLTVDEYERLVASGALVDPKVELIEGYLVTKMGKKPRHSTGVERLRRLLEQGLPLPNGWHVRHEQPVRIPEFNEPEPDLAIVRGDVEDFENQHPRPGDVGLIVEVSDSSLVRDQGPKWVAYSRGGIPVYWIVNLVDHQLEVYSEPGPDGYRLSQTFHAGDEVPVVLNGVEVGRIAVSRVLP